MDNVLLIVAAAVVILGAGIAWFLHANLRGKPARLSLAPGDPLPDFEAEAEDGSPLAAESLRGSPAVILFVRGNWCPFCNSQVEDLTRHYKEITDLGGRLVFITPKPLETTRRVADMFGVDFEFWLDPDLAVARRLGLLHEAGVPGKHRDEYGSDTVWPTSLVTDADGVVTYVSQSKRIVDRPDPQELLAALKRLG